VSGADVESSEIRDGGSRGGASVAPAATPLRDAPRGAQGTVRRIIVFTILFVLVCIAASGVAGLLGRLFETRPEFIESSASLALPLAYTLIGGPLAVLLWWFQWRRLDGPDRESVAWGLYLSAALTVALIMFVTTGLAVITDLIGGRWFPTTLGTAIAWLLVWVAHRLMWASAHRSPLRLTTVPVVLGAAYGLAVAASGAINALKAVFDAAVITSPWSIGVPWWQPALQAIVWTVGGTLVWVWHWHRDGTRRLSGGFADVALVLTGVLAAAAVALGGLGTALYVGLRAAFDRDESWHQLLSPLGLGVAAAGVGAVIWRYHRGVATERRDATRNAARMVEAGVGLIGAASGIGVIVNALLASFAAPLSGSDARTLLLGGIASLAVGAPVWWWAWRPRQAAADAGSTGRRVYLIAVFGVSAVVAIVALLIVGYRIFEFALEGGNGGVVERIRAPFGLLLATALVAAYHFAVWRRDREAVPAAPTRTLARVVLVAGGDGTPTVQAVRDATGASVTVWGRADGAAAPDPQAVTAALAAVEWPRVLVIPAADGTVQVIPLTD